MLSDHAQSSSAPPTGNHRRFRFFRRKILVGIALSAVAVVVGLFVITGPAFPSVVRWAGLKAAQSQGISGDFTVVGSLWSGVSLKEVSLKGEESPLVSLTLESLEIDYELRDLVTAAASLNWLNRLTVENAVLEISLPDPTATPTPEAAKGKSKTTPETTDFSPIWNLLRSGISIQNISVLVHAGDTTYELESFSFSHAPESGGEIQVSSLSIPDRDPISALSAQIRAGNRSLTLDQFLGSEVETLKHLTLAEPRPGRWTVDAGLSLGGGTVSLFADTDGVVKIDLPTEETIDLARLPLPAESAGLSGVVTALAIQFAGDFEDPSSWDFSGRLHLDQPGFEKIILDSVELELTRHEAALEVNAPGTRLSAVVTAPLGNFSTTADLARIPIDLAADLKVESLKAILQSFEIDLPLDGAIEGRVENVQLLGDGTVRSGSLLVASETLAWEGEPVPALQIAANVPEENLVRLAGSAALDAATELNFKGETRLDALTYEGGLSGRFATEGALEALLRNRELADYTGSGTVQWTGRGSLREGSHRGEATVSGLDLTIREGRAMNLNLAARYDEKSAHLTEIRVDSAPLLLTGTAAWADERLSLDDLALSLNGERAFTLGGGFPLPRKMEHGFLSQPGEVALTLSATDLAVQELALLSGPESPLSGNLNGEVAASGTWQDLGLKGKFNFRPELEGQPGDPTLALDFKLNGDTMRPQSWKAELQAILSGLEWQEIRLGDLALRAMTREEAGGKWIDASLEATQEGATLTAGVKIDLSGAETLEALAACPLQIETQFEAPDLAPLWQQLAPPSWRNIPVAGALSLRIDDLHAKGTEITAGAVDLHSDTLRIDGEALEKLSVRAQVDEPNALTAAIQLYADERSRIDGSGAFHLIEQTGEGSIDLILDLDRDGVLKRLLGKREIANLLPATTRATFNAAGNGKEKTFRGDFDLSGKSLTLAKGAVPIDAFAADGSFSERSLDSRLEIRSEPINIDSALGWDGAVFTVTRLDGSTGGKSLFTARGSFPMVLDKLTPELWLSQEAPLSFQLNSDPIALSALMRLVKDRPPVDGTLDLDLELGGTAANPEIDLSLDLTNIALPEQEDLKVGALTVRLIAKDAKAALEGEYRHPDVNPLSLNASLPFFPKEWALGGRDILKEPITASARMDRSSLAFLSTQVPAIKSIEGVLGLDVKVAGTISTPLISGAGILEVSRLRLNNRDAPSFYDIDLRTRFAENRLVIERLNAIVAGGEVEASGNVLFAPEKEPEFDLRLGAKEALIFRTPDLSLRTDADLTLTGPWSGALLAGSVGLTNSRFFKNFDLLPQSLPTRSTSALPTVERTPTGGGAAYADLKVGVDVAPFRDWISEVRIYTQDPFQVRSNLVESDLVADLRITGKLAAPTPTGFIAINEGELSLPFSSIDVEVGRIEFDQKTGFNGALNLKAKAKADKYRINVFLYNRILDPKYVLTSSPPMPTEDLMTLLVTGTTRDALLGSDVGSLAASKAATLLLKNFRKASASADGEPTLLDALQDRTELEIGRVNPDTGAETVGGKIRLWKQLFFVGDVDAENDYRALLKYVFRFR